MKKLFEYFRQGSPMYIVLHAQYRQSRGRRPVAVSAIEHNPREALQIAKDKLVCGANCVRVVKAITATLMNLAIRRVGLKLPNMDEVLTLLEKKEQQDIITPFNLVWRAGKWTFEDGQDLDENWNPGPVLTVFI